MESIMSEFPLAIFTACVLLGTGGYVALGITAAMRHPDAAECPRGDVGSNRVSDKAPLVFLAVVLIGFVAAFFHLASPMHAIFALTGIGRSPMTNEIAVGVVFAGAAALYCILKMTGKLKGDAERTGAIILAVLGPVFAAFTGAAYLMGTIATWGTPLSIVESVGLSLLAGPVMLMALNVLLSWHSPSKAERAALLTAAVAGAVIGFGALGAHVFQSSGLHSSMVQGSSLVQGIMAPLAVSIIFGAASLVLCWRTSGNGAARKAYSVTALILVVISVFAARFVFYGLQLSVGL